MTRNFRLKKVGLVYRNIVCVFLLFLGTSCSLAKNEAFKLRYKERRVVDLFKKEPLLSLRGDGSWDYKDHQALFFDGDTLVLEVTTVNLDQVFIEQYALEVIQDTSLFEGIYRMFGSGNWNGQYMGISAITNFNGSLVRIAVSSNGNKVLDEARAQKTWNYVSTSLVYRIFTIFPSEQIVKLNPSDLKLYVDNTTNVQFSEKKKRGRRSVETPRGLSAQFDRIKKDPQGVVERNVMETVLVDSWWLAGINREIYKLTDGRYLGIDYFTDELFNKQRMKFAYGSDIASVIRALDEQTVYDWESEKTANIPYRVLERIKENPIVTLTGFTAPPVGASQNSIVIPSAYDWENVSEYTFNLDTLLVKVINVHNKISNESIYRVRMISDVGNTEGVFQFSGIGLLDNLYAKLKITNINNLAGWLVMSDNPNTFDQQSKTNQVQDRVKAQQPHRVMIEMQQRGRTWVGVEDDGVYNNLATTNWIFDSDTLLVQAKIITNSVPKTSTYITEVVNNDSWSKGTLLLRKTNVNFPESENDTDSDTPFDNCYFAVKLGSGIDNGRALMEIGSNRESVEARLEQRTMYNLHEQSVVPSVNKIVRTLANLSPWVKLKNNYYSETETEVWWFNAEIMEAVLMNIQSTGSTVITNASRFTVEMQRDVSPTEGAFQLKSPNNNNPIKTDYPKNNGTGISTAFDTYLNKMVYVTTGSATTVNRAYIGIADTVDEAKRERPLDNPNYHTRADAPFSSEVIASIINNAKGKGEVYVELSRNATTGTSPDRGLYVPYDTKEVKFSLDPLQVTITTITEENTRFSETFPLQMVKSEGPGKAVAQYQGQGSLAGKYVGLAVQLPSGNAPGTYLSMVTRDTLLEASTEIDKLIVEQQWTHNVKYEEKLGSIYLLTDLFLSVDQVTDLNDYTNRLHDIRNTTNIIFNTTDEIVTVNLVVNGVSQKYKYAYEVMSTNANTTYSNTIVKLSGMGLYANHFLGFSLVQDAMNSLAGRIAIGSTFGATDRALISAHTNFYKSNDITKNNHIIQRSDSGMHRFANAISSIGDTVVLVDNKGIYDPKNTQELSFDALNDTLTVTKTENSAITTHKYHIIYPKNASNFISGDSQDTELQSRVYLKSYEGDRDAPLNSNFVEMKVEAGRNPGKILFATSGNSLTEASNLFLALKGQWNYLKKSDVDVDMKAIVSASGFTWTRLVTNDYLFYYDPNNTENWSFDAAKKIVTIEVNGMSQEYRIGMKESISGSEGIFVLAGTSEGMPYDGKIVFLGLGTDLYDKNVNARIFVSTSTSADENLKIAEVKTTNNIYKDAHHWNFREQSLAIKGARAIVKAASEVEEWNSLNSDGNKDDNNYISLKFQGGTQKEHSRYTNIKIRVVGSPNGMISMEEENFSYKVVSDDSETRGIFQLIRGSNSQFTNKYIAIELGTEVNDRLMKFALGDTPRSAQDNLNSLTYWNYSDKKRIEATDRVVREAVGRGSGTWTMYLHVDPPIIGNNNPQYISTAATNITFDTIQKTLKFEYISPLGQSTYIKENIYGYEMIEDNSSTQGVFKLTGYGEYGNQFVALELSPSTVRASNRGRMAINIDAGSAKKGLRNIARQWNVFEKTSLIMDPCVIITAMERGIITSLDHYGVHDPENATDIEFHVKNNADITMKVIEHVNGVPRPTVYQLEMVEDISFYDGTFLIRGPGDWNLKYGRVKFLDGSHDEVAVLVVDSVDDLTDKNIESTEAKSVKYRIKNKLPQDKGLLDRLITVQPFVVLNDKKVYVPKDSAHITFNKVPDTGLVSGKTTMTVIINDMSYVYNVLQVSNNTITENEATYFLKTSTLGAPWNNKYLLVKVDGQDSQKNIKTVRVGLGSDLIDMTNDFVNTGIDRGFIVRNYQYANWVRSKEFSSDKVLQDIVKMGNSIGIVRAGFNDPRDIDQWTFDVPNRKIIIKKADLFSTPQALAGGNISVDPVSTYEYFFNVISNLENQSEVLLSLNSYSMISLINTTVVDEYVYFKLSDDVSRRYNFFSMNYSKFVNFAREGALLQHITNQPGWRTLHMALNSTAVITNLGLNRKWVPIKSGTVDKLSRGVQITNIYTSVKANRAPGGNYREYPYLVYSPIDAYGRQKDIKDLYVPIVYQYNGPFDAVIMLEQESYNRPNTKKNKFLAITVGTGLNLYKARIAEGNTLAEAIQKRSEVGWNYRIQSSVGADSRFRRAFDTSGVYGGKLSVDGGKSQYYSIAWLYADEMVITVEHTKGKEKRKYQYRVEVLQVLHSELPQLFHEFIIMFNGFGDLSGKLGRVQFDAREGEPAAQMRITIASDVHTLDKQWRKLTYDPYYNVWKRN